MFTKCASALNDNILVLQNKYISFNYLDTNYGPTLYSATSTNPWTAPASGILHVDIETNGSSIAYVNIVDKTFNKITTGQALKGASGNYSISKTICVIKNHQYYRGTNSGISTFPRAYLIEIKLV